MDNEEKQVVEFIDKLKSKAPYITADEEVEAAQVLGELFAEGVLIYE